MSAKFRSLTTETKSALLISYAFEVNVFDGLEERHLREITNLLRIHADRRQLQRLRGEIDDILTDEMELHRVVKNQLALEDIRRLLPAGRLEGEDGERSGRRRPKRRFPGARAALAERLRGLLRRAWEWCGMGALPVSAGK